MYAADSNTIPTAAMTKNPKVRQERHFQITIAIHNSASIHVICAWPAQMDRPPTTVRNAAEVDDGLRIQLMTAAKTHGVQAMACTIFGNCAFVSSTLENANVPAATIEASIENPIRLVKKCIPIAAIGTCITGIIPAICHAGRNAFSHTVG